MGYELGGSDFRVAVSESYVRAGDLATLLGYVNILYEDLAILYLFESKPFEFEKARVELVKDTNAVLRVTKISSGSDLGLSLVGIDKVIEVLRKIVDEIRFRKERRTQEEEKTKQSEEKTAQEREKTQRMQIENLGRTLDTYERFKKMSHEHQQEFLLLIQKSTSRIEENPQHASP